MPIAPDRTRVESIFVRHRNTLMVRANFTDIFTDHYLHLADHKLKPAPDLDLKLKELLVALTLYFQFYAAKHQKVGLLNFIG